MKAGQTFSTGRVGEEYSKQPFPSREGVAENIESIKGNS